MGKKKLLINIGLVIILIVCMSASVVLAKKDKQRRDKEAKENITLTNIGYETEIGQVGYDTASGILGAFIQAYNEHDGAGVAAIMDQVGLYIYVEECDSDQSKFDDKYEEILSNPSEEYDDLIIMQYSLQKQEKKLVDLISKTNVTLELVGGSEIQDVTKYLSKMTAKIRTVSADDGIDEVDTLGFLLLHRDQSYYIMDYYLADENGNKIENVSTGE